MNTGALLCFISFSIKERSRNVSFCFIYNVLWIHLVASNQKEVPFLQEDAHVWWMFRGFAPTDVEEPSPEHLGRVRPAELQVYRPQYSVNLVHRKQQKPSSIIRIHRSIGADGPPNPPAPTPGAPCLVSEQLALSHRCAHSRYVANLSPSTLSLSPLSIPLCPLKPFPSLSLFLAVSLTV